MASSKSSTDKPQRKSWGLIRIILIVVLVAVVVTVTFVGGVNMWEYTNSPEFCGTACHTMPPEYVAYQVSPHARVDCVECHIGRDRFTTLFGRKAGEIAHVVRLATKNYEVPIFVKSMRPASDSCEKCHWREKFSNDSVREIKHYSDDEGNSEQTTYLIMKTGGGSSRQGQGYGIHWHIENEVLYIAGDERKQDIPWVRVIDGSGKVTDYVDVEADISEEFIANGEKHRIDCLDCHNRISHLFRSPEQAMDQALALKHIDRRIPFIKRVGLEVLSNSYASTDEAMAAIAAIEKFYRERHPGFYAEDKETITTAVTWLQNSYKDIVFPDMGVTWDTHADNIGHRDFPGCFRCHDGKHLNADKEAIRLECNICHTIPSVSMNGDGANVVSLTKQPEPAAHLDPNWLALHRVIFDDTCANCHDTSNPGGKDNTSFCSNSACHGTVWKYAGLDAPAVVELANSYNVAPLPGIPHPVKGLNDCLMCHAIGGVKPVPSNHAGRANDTCQGCHKPKS